MAVILWGKPTITITAVSSGTGTSADLTVPTPAAGTVQLSTDTGDEHTADLEGGGYEARRFDKNSFVFEFAVRFAAGRTMPFEDVSTDGVITGQYSVKCKGIDTDSPEMTMHLANVRYEDEMDMDDGARRHYYFESLVPDPTTQVPNPKQITWSHASAS